jgi:hypothetical protein
MQSWAWKELKEVEFGDARRSRRAVKLLEALAAQPALSVPTACQTPAATKAAYRFLSSERIKPDAIRAAHQKSTIERIQKHQVILAIQDTTTLDFTHHPSKRGMGPGDNPACLGLKVHSVLAACTQGVPLGLLHQEVWARDPHQTGLRNSRRQRETKDKESQRWLTAMAATESSTPDGIKVVTVADREADIYDLFAMPRRPGSDLLIRATHNRRVNHEARYLQEAIKMTPPCGQLTVEVPRGASRPARIATLTIRYATLELSPPRHHLKRSQLQPVTISVVLALEVNQPSGETPIRWLLLTTLTVGGFDDAVICLRWYSYRWLIERYHYVLKSGCCLEKLQLETADRIERALAIYSIVAWRLLWLTCEARRNRDAACDTVLEAHEWQALYCTIHKTPIPPLTPPLLSDAVRWIAQLGGFLGRKQDGDPGVKTIWCGWRRLQDIAATWLLLHPNSPESVDSPTCG